MYEYLKYLTGQSISQKKSVFFFLIGLDKYVYAYIVIYCRWISHLIDKMWTTCEMGDNPSHIAICAKKEGEQPISHSIMWKGEQPIS